MRNAFGGAIGAMAIWLVLAAVAAAQPHVVRRPFTIVHRDQDDTTIIRVRTRDGRVRSDEVVRALMAAEDLDEQAVAGLLPAKDFSLNGLPSVATLAALNLAMRGAVTFSVLREGEAPSLQIAVRRDVARQKLRQWKADLRRRVLHWHNESEQFSFAFDDDWRETDAPLVVLLHGYASRPGSLRAMRRRLRAAGLSTATFGYPNDGPIYRSGTVFADALAELTKQAPERDLQIVAHSMGGLVARVAVELEPPEKTRRVRRLLTVATPHRGTALARIPLSVDAWEAIIHGRDSELSDFFADGLNEARDDLRPDSRLMKKLAAAKRRSGVRYATLIGKQGLIRGAELKTLRASLTRWQQRHVALAALGPRLQKHLEDLDEIVDGKGDGVVSVARGRLKGVTDVQVLDFPHWALTDQLADYPQLAREVLKRAK